MMSIKIMPLTTEFFSVVAPIAWVLNTSDCQRNEFLLLEVTERRWKGIELPFNGTSTAKGHQRQDAEEITRCKQFKAMPRTSMAREEGVMHHSTYVASLAKLPDIHPLQLVVVVGSCFRYKCILEYVSSKYHSSVYEKSTFLLQML